MSEKIHLTPLVTSRLPDEDVRNAVRFCPQCGREIPLDQQKCAFCANTSTVPHSRTSRWKKIRLIAAIVLICFLCLLLALYLTR